MMLFCLLLLTSAEAFAVEGYRAELTLKNQVKPEIKEVSQLPSHLRVINDEAFAGTGIESIQIPESVCVVGEKAFADNAQLSIVFFLSEKLNMANNAFSGSQVVLSGFSDSEVKYWAKENGYKFEIKVAITTEKSVVRFSAKLEISDKAKQQLLEKEKDIAPIVKKERQTGRAIGELKATKYKGIAAVHVQSRYFP